MAQYIEECDKAIVNIEFRIFRTSTHALPRGKYQRELEKVEQRRERLQAELNQLWAMN